VGNPDVAARTLIVDTGGVATPYAEVLARNVRAARARAGIDQTTVAYRMSNLGFGAWVRQTVTKVERGNRRITAEEVLGLSLALETTVSALMMPANEDDGIILPGGGMLPGHGVQTSVMGFSVAAFWEGDRLQPFPTHALPQPETWPPVRTLRGAGAAAPRSPVSSTDLNEVRPVVAAIVTSPLGVLIGRRNDGKPPWTFIAGEVEPGERPEDAAVREVKEETGLLVKAGALIGERVHPKTGRTMIYMAATPTHGTDVFVGDPDELAEVRWVSVAEAEELLPGMFKPVLDYLREQVASS
jgi:8-oxo-dGTP pyrophosphatase MutT (NUDIX family)/transcriptional regulator with XRE-family HTH domain